VTRLIALLADSPSHLHFRQESGFAPKQLQATPVLLTLSGKDRTCSDVVDCSLHRLKVQFKESSRPITSEPVLTVAPSHLISLPRKPDKSLVLESCIRLLSSSLENSMPPLKNKEYTVGWICALLLEMAAARSMLDKSHRNPLEQYPKDNNSYFLGTILLSLA
jgi:hypothetical protein